MKYIYILVLILITSCSTKEEIDTGVRSMNDCKTLSSFVNQLGFPANTTAFVTNEKRITGICVKDVNAENKIYQHATWTDKGSMGPLAIDEQGNVYVAPIPFVNVLDAVRKNQNIIYKINAQNGILNTCIQFEGTQDTVNTQNGYGAVGLYYDCENKLLYASNIYGSTRTQENGKIYCIDVKKEPATVLDTYNNVDAIGIGVCYFNNHKTLFYGNARTHTVHRITLKEDGTFTKQNTFCFSLDGLGSRGDDVAKKIRFTKQNTMLIIGATFDYNLTAPSNAPEVKYEFQFDMNDETWKLVK